jgi:hypothetical protein
MLCKYFDRYVAFGTYLPSIKMVFIYDLMINNFLVIQQQKRCDAIFKCVCTVGTSYIVQLLKISFFLKKLLYFEEDSYLF